MPVNTCRIRRISLAWIAMSDAWPEAPPEGSIKDILVVSQKGLGRKLAVNHDTSVG